MQQLHEEWLQTPRETLEGKRPAELLDGGRLLPEKVSTFRREQPKVGRNDPCPCGSGKKHKKCCGKGG
jgi:preprotein translocase subunit SecA